MPGVSMPHRQGLDGLIHLVAISKNVLKVSFLITFTDQLIRIYLNDHESWAQYLDSSIAVHTSSPSS